MRSCIRKVIFLSVLISIVSCSFNESPAPEIPDSQIVSTEEDKKLPFVLSVGKELNDGEHLVVVAELSAQAAWNTSNMVLKLSGFNNGNLVGELKYPVVQTTSFLREGEKRDIPLVLTASGITDYQLELVWGNDSGTQISGKTVAGGVPLTLSDLAISSERTNCGRSGCEIRFTLASEISNNSNSVIKGAILGTGFIWTHAGDKLDLSSNVPENEAEIELKDLDLGPGASRKIRLVLDQTVPERTDGAFRPTLRIKSFN